MTTTSDSRETEVGVVPEQWTVTALENLVSLQRGYDLTQSQRRRGDVPVVGAAGPNGFHDTALAGSPGVVVGRSGASFGKAHFCDSNYWPHNTALFVTDFHGNDPLFAYYLLDFLDFDRHNSGGAQPSLNRNSIYTVTLGLPGLEEQRAIAAALADVDALIEKLDALIAKKRAIKTGAMQALLTGEQHLPGFSGAWETKRLRELAFVQKGELITAKTARKGRVPVVAGGKKPTYYHDTPNQTQPCVTVSASGAYAGFVDFWDSPIFASDCSTVTPRGGASVRFLYYWMRNQQSMIYGLQTGGAQPHVQPKHLAPLEVKHPPVAEQRAIAEVLADMDAEIEALQSRRAKTQAVKQGMMQELLTGKTRLIDNG